MNAGRNWLFGVYTGGDTTPQANNGFNAFMTWMQIGATNGASLRNSIQFTTVFNDGQSSWAGIANTTGWAAGNFAGSGIPILWSMPMTINGAGGDNNNSALAAGSHDADIIQEARIIASYATGWPAFAGFPAGKQVIRLGWEMNGNWEPWSPAFQGTTALDYINAWRHIVILYRSVSDRFLFDWNPNVGMQSTDPETMYPGDDYVDFVGVDAYDNGTGDAQDAWDRNLSDPRGLDWVANTYPNKPLGFGEFAYEGNDGDSSGLYVNNWNNWMQGRPMAFVSYFNSGDPSYVPPYTVTSNLYPQSSGVMLKLWGVWQAGASTLTCPREPDQKGHNRSRDRGLGRSPSSRSPMGVSR